MNKYILIFLIAVTGGLAAGASSANAQTFTCPYGYTCVPISQAPITCPYGYTCVPINNQYPQYPTYPTYPSNTAGPLRIISPNGGESFQIGTSRAIQWTSPAYFRATYADIKLLRTTTCTTYICPMIAYAPYTIASNISINQNSFNWVVGQTVAGNPYNTGSYMTVPDGQYTVQVCETGTSNCDSSDSSFTIYSGSGYPGNPGYPNNQPPVISGIDAPTSLSVGQTGTWTIHAADSQNGILNYSVDWGDQGAYIYPQSSLSSSGQYTQTTTFTHSYNTTGVFTVTFTVRNAAGVTTQSKTTVNVGSTANQQPLTLITPNGGEIWRRGTQQPITWTTQSNTYPYYSGYNNTGTVRITLNYQCPAGMYCMAQYRPAYIIQNSAPNSGSSSWLVGSATVDGVTAVSVPSGTYIMTICRYDTSYYGQSPQQTACDTSNSPFTLTE